jgi:8-oxo-dGTP diphosphatase
VARELKEELGLDTHVGEELLATTHVYAERSVELHFFLCVAIGEPSPQLGQEMLWAQPADLKHLPFPPADTELIAMLTKD